MKPKTVVLGKKKRKTAPVSVVKKKPREVAMKRQFATPKKAAPRPKTKTPKPKRLTFFWSLVQHSLYGLLRFRTIERKGHLPYHSVVLDLPKWRVLKQKKGKITTRTTYQARIRNQTVLLEVVASNRMKQGPIRFNTVSVSARKCPWKK